MNQDHIERKLQIIKVIQEKFSESNITWGLGGSFLLYLNNINVKPNDIDLIVKEEDEKSAVNILPEIGQEQPVMKKHPFLTKVYKKYSIMNCDVDVMINFSIQHSNGIYTYWFNQHSVVYSNDGEYPLCTLEDWYLLYQLIPSKLDKVILIEEYWENHGIHSPNILYGKLDGSLPKAVHNRMTKFLERS